MPKNLFGKMKPNLLMQQGPIQMPPQQYFTPTQPPQNPEDDFVGPTMEMLRQPRKEVPAPRDNGFLGHLLGGPAAERFVRSQGGIVEHHGKPNPTETLIDYMFPRDVPGVNAPGHVPGTGDARSPKAPQAPPPAEAESQPSALDEYIASQFAGQANGPSFTGGFDLGKLGGLAQSRQQQMDAFKQQFEGTPELDKMITDAQGRLAQVKGERKKPGLGEFLTLALMNLGNRDHRNNADMILGTSQQQRNEEGLETLINQLEGNRASAKMGGRRQMQAMQQSERNSALERQLRNAETQRKQSNEDREFQRKSNNDGVNLLRQIAGQEGQIQGSSMDEKTRSNAMKAREQLLKAMGVDPTSLRAIIQQRQQQQAPKDDRQSRLFGDFLAGGGYA